MAAISDEFLVMIKKALGRDMICYVGINGVRYNQWPLYAEYTVVLKLMNSYG